MNKGQLLDNPEHLFFKKTLSLFEEQVQFQELMAECSSQVDDEKLYSTEQIKKMKKKNKKKQYKRRKKEQKIKAQRKMIGIQQSAHIYLTKIIQKIYAGKTCFQNEYSNIEFCLWNMIGGNKFHDFLNQTIRYQVCNVQKNIWDYMQLILHQTALQKDEDDQKFYLLMVDRIYEEYLDIKNSSIQIQKIINLFVKLASGQEPQDNESHQLDKSTFKFLIQTDETIKSLVRMCEQKISIRHYKQVMRLKEIGLMMIHDDYNEEDQQEEDIFGIMEQSTEIDDQEDEKQEKLKQMIINSSRKKIKQKLWKEAEEVSEALNFMKIKDQERLNCRVSQGWLKSLEKKVLKER